VVTFLWSWDDFLFPSIVLTNPAVKTLPLVLAGLRSLFWDRYELFAAGSMLTVVPVMLLYAVMQKQFVRGIALTGLNR
jgi:multiple sugar transport system permease protein